MKTLKKALAKEEGVAFIITIIVLGIMIAFLVLFSMLVMRDSFNSQRGTNVMRALYVAEAGANMALRELQQGEDGDIGQTAFGGGSYEANTTSGTIVSVGIVNGRSKTIKLNITNPMEAFDYGVFTDGLQEYSGGGSTTSVVINGNVHSNRGTPHINNPNHDIVGDGYEIETGPDLGFPELDIGYYETIATSGGDNHYYTDGDTLTNITLPQAGGVTLVKLTGSDAGTELSITSGGNGLLIVVGGDVKMTGGSSYTGLVYVNDSNMDGTGLGGNVRIGGNYTVTGIVVSRTANTIHGTAAVTYDPSAFDIDYLHVDTDKIIVYSWQSS